MIIEPVEANGHSIDAAQLRRAIIGWGEEHFRYLPWRMTTNPFDILMSEVMLHRTQARQVVPVYERFIRTYPDMKVLAHATKEDLSHMLCSLGLYWRIEVIHEMIAELVDRFNGEIPRNKEDLISLPGVSEYIAGAVRCFAWNLPEPIPDTNTVRITGRLFGLQIKDSSRRNAVFKDLLTKLVDPDEPRAFNYAQLDLADKVCTRRQLPDCHQCPLLQWCSFGNDAIKLQLRG